MIFIDFKKVFDKANREKYLTSLIKRIVKQTYKHYA